MFEILVVIQVSSVLKWVEFKLLWRLMMSLLKGLRFHLGVFWSGRVNARTQELTQEKIVLSEGMALSHLSEFCMEIQIITF